MREIWSQLLTMGPPADTTAPAFVTTLHLALAMLRNYRPKAKGRLLLLPSLVFIIAPWFLSTPLWLALGLASHVAWFTACEALLENAPAPQRRVVPRPAAHAALSPRPSRDFKPAEVLAVVEETPEIRTFRIARPVGFEFKAGQFLMVRVTVDEKPVVRCYSISSSPSAGGYLEISVRRQGPVSALLHDVIRPGMMLDVRGPGGAFVQPEGTRPLVLIAGGIGITPLLSMLRHTLESQPSRAVTLVLSSRTAAQMPFLEELRLLARHSPEFRFVPVLSGGSPDATFYSGRVDAKLLETVLHDAAESVCMICGPLPMIDDVREIVARLGVSPSRIHFEKFEAAVASATGHQENAESVRVTFRPGGRAVAVAAGQSILDAAEAAGESIPSLCRVGACGTCRIRLVEGRVEGDFDAIDRSDQEAGFVLACVARPVTPCVVEA